MSVYVDDMKAPYGRMVMCHMIADTPAELREMAHRIRVPVRWIQNADTYREHFDICMSKRARAVHYGAKEITWHELGEMILARRRATAPLPTSSLPPTLNMDAHGSINV